MPTPDVLWKIILETMFEDAMRFFLPDYADQIDFARGVQFMDKELEDLIPAAIRGRRQVDKLAACVFF